ncbi:MAG: FAD-binding oxidoreductase [Planctomycetes bacterium]|nr:FAD-binding oxidoreductase [Planctomycetota bacterium]
MPDTSMYQLDAAEQIAVVQAGMLVSDLQDEVSQHGLMLGVMHDPDSSLSIGDLFMQNHINLWQGKFGYLRDQVLGGKWRLADGTTINSGAQVVKSVAGYDLTRMLLGSGHNLAECINLRIRLRPLLKEFFYYRLSIENYLQYSHYDLQPMAAIADGAQHIIICYHHQLHRDYVHELDYAKGEQACLDLLRAFHSLPARKSLDSRPDMPPHINFDWNSWQYPHAEINKANSLHLSSLQRAICPNIGNDKNA